MSFLGKVINGAVGLATGGVGGAVLGLAGDLLGGAGGGSEQSSQQTQQTSLRAWTPVEQSLYDQAAAGLAASGKPMTPAMEAQIRQRIYNATFQPQQQAIQEGLATAGATRYSQAARRGAGQSSATVAGSATDAAVAARELGLASQNATLAAENQLMQQKQMQIQASQNYVQTMNALWDQRLKGSSIVTSQSQQSPGGGLLGGLGYALGNKDSWLNTNVLGKKTATTTRPITSAPAGNAVVPNWSDPSRMASW